MEAATEPTTEPQEPPEVTAPPEAQESPEEPPEASDGAAKTPSQMFRFARWVHIGDGAEECEKVNEEAGEVTCDDPEHFHAWIRLPNQFQHKEIREKAQAARARRVRQLRDPASDSHEILEYELDNLAHRGDNAKEALVEEVAMKDWWDDTVQASKDLIEVEEDGEKVWEHIERDQLRLREIHAMPEEKQPEEEKAELVRHLDRYAEDLEKATDERFEPRKQALMELDINQLIDEVRDQRIDAEAQKAFMDTYNAWAWYVGTLKRKPMGTSGQGPNDRRFSSIEEMKDADEEVLLAIEASYGQIEIDGRRAAEGN